jgi:CelD/BcsL family acetyltransferase involved in cellulose biosynthesis
MSLAVQLEDFESLETEWQRLLPKTAANTIFITPLWQKLWWQHFGQDANLHILSVRQDEELIGIAPLMLTKGVLSFLGDTDLFDYHDFLVKNGKEVEFYDVLCEYLIELDWHTIELKSLRESSVALERLKTLADQKGFKTEIVEEDVSPFAVLTPTWDEYQASMRKKNRHELRRKTRRLEAGGNVNQYSCGDPATIGECMPDFFRLMRASSPDKDGFLTEERELFFNDMAKRLAEEGIFKLFFMEVDSKRVASCIAFDYGDAYLLYNSGYDPEYSALSVGLLNKAFCLREALEAGKGTFDFLRGTERYKYDLGGQNQIVYQMTIKR